MELKNEEVNLSLEFKKARFMEADLWKQIYGSSSRNEVEEVCSKQQKQMECCMRTTYLE